ncbi:2,5-dichloro-2,5-cyclohexadiene-1,4-diol dehydrogenase domain protein [Burkholderia pseudomallei MSHR3709]|nr:2,5-dichloro-2,5-cyclohexadiene-1,4-diol dehydrogenase domain protein [Burkholderia pseudomallei MSHR3709]
MVTRKLKMKCKECNQLVAGVTQKRWLSVRYGSSPTELRLCTDMRWLRTARSLPHDPVRSLNCLPEHLKRQNGKSCLHWISVNTPA